MNDKRSATSIKVRYAIKLAIGLAFLAAVMALIYWLLFVYQVRNLVGLALIIVFLIMPSLVALLRIPWEIRGLIAVLRSDDPAALDNALGDVRERRSV